MCDNFQVSKLRKKHVFFVILMKNAVVTPLKVDQFGRNFNWRYFTSSTTSMSNFVKMEALKTPKIAFEVSLNFTIFLNYIF